MPRSRRGRHDRNWIWFSRSGNWDYADEVEVVYEEPCTTHYGTFGVISDGWAEYYVIWRANRNHTSASTVFVMDGEACYEPAAIYRMGYAHSYASKEEAIEAIKFYMFNWHPPKKRKRGKSSRARDAQKTKVYTWEAKMARKLGEKVVVKTGTYPNGHIYEVVQNRLTHRRTMQYLREKLHAMCAELGVTAPALLQRKGGTHSFGSRKRIRLLPRDMNEWILIHEFAHSLHSIWGCDPRVEQSHGKEFVGIYCYLLIRFGGVNERELLDSCRDAGVKFELPSRYFEWREISEAA